MKRHAKLLDTRRSCHEMRAIQSSLPGIEYSLMDMMGLFPTDGEQPGANKSSSRSEGQILHTDSVSSARDRQRRMSC
jgi:hypothetical protein